MLDVKLGSELWHREIGEFYFVKKRHATDLKLLS